MTYREIVAEIERLPQAEQQALLLWLVKHARIEIPRREPRLVPSAKLVRGILKQESQTPTNDWDRPEEDEAWSHLGQLPSL